MNYLILDNFNENYLDYPEEYGITGFQIIEDFHKIFFKNKERMIRFLREEDYRNPEE